MRQTAPAVQRQATMLSSTRGFCLKGMMTAGAALQAVPLALRPQVFVPAVQAHSPRCVRARCSNAVNQSIDSEHFTVTTPLYYVNAGI